MTSNYLEKVISPLQIKLFNTITRNLPAKKPLILANTILTRMMTFIANVAKLMGAMVSLRIALALEVVLFWSLLPNEATVMSNLDL